MQFGNMSAPMIPEGLLRPMHHLKPTQAPAFGSGGKYVSTPDERIPFRGRVMPVTNKDLMFAPEGLYTTESVKLYTHGYLLQANDVIEDSHDGAVYVITNILDHQDIHPLKRYVMKRKGGASNR